jgi:uncharacterized repeat protein (TIGR01451 family)
MTTAKHPGRTRRPRSTIFGLALAVSIAIGQASLSALADPPVDTPGPASADGVVPVIRDTRSSNDDCVELGFDHGISIAANGQVSSGDLTVTVSGYNSPTGFVDWSSNLPIHGVYVKGGPSGGNLFSYPSGDTGDQDLHTPQKADGSYYSVSHLAFCWNDVALEPDVVVEKANGPAGAVLANGTITYTLKVSNDGTGDATGVVVTDALPAGVSFDSATPGCTEVAGTVTCDLGDIGAGASLSVEITVTVDEGTCGTIANVATVSATNEQEDDEGNNTSNEVTNTVTCDEPSPPDVQVSKSSDAEGVLGQGDTFSYTITVTNVGDEAATGVTFNDDLPEGEPLTVDLSSWPTFDGALCTIASSVGQDGIVHQSVHCGPTSLDPGESQTVTINVIVTGDDCGTITNVVDVTASNEPAGNVGPDNHDEVADEVECVPRIRLVKGGPDLAHVGDTVTYRFAVINNGSVDLTDVVLSDPDCEGPLQRTDDGNGDATLAVGERWEYRCDRTIVAADGDVVPNEATVQGGHEGGAVSDTDDHLIEVIHPAIGIDKTASPTSGAPGTTIVYTYVVTNTGDTDLYDIAVTDDRLGAIGTVAFLAAGASAELTAQVALGDSPVTNVGTASGHDVLGLSVSATDAASVTVVAAGGGSGGGSPFTGAETAGPIALAILLLTLGAALVGGTRRRAARNED